MIPLFLLLVALFTITTDLVSANRELNKCKPFSEKCTLSLIDERPFFVIDDFDEGKLDCADYAGDYDIVLDEPNDYINNFCSVSRNFCVKYAPIVYKIFYTLPKVIMIMIYSYIIRFVQAGDANGKAAN